MSCLFKRPAGEQGDKIHQHRVNQHEAIKQVRGVENELT